MYVITVIPISRGIGKENLSYFTAAPVELGSVVEVPLRKKYVSALVIESKDARSMKTEIRKADFSLRKIEKLTSKPFLSEAFMKTVNETARFHAATVGATLNVMLPKKILETLLDRSEKVKEKEITIVPIKEQKGLLPSSLAGISENVKQITIEDITSQSYKSISRPFIDFRYALERYATHIGAKVIKKEKALNPKIAKILEEHKKEEGTVFNSIGKQLEKDIKNLKRKPGHLFILGTRKGHSGTVLCQDCGHVFTCERCEAPLTLHLKAIKEEFNNMLCHHCGYKTTAHAACPTCGGWRLKAYGLGIEKIEEDVQALIKKNNIKAYVQRIDSTLKLTPKKIKDYLATHHQKEKSILIGTELLLPYMASNALKGEKNIASYIASLDTLFSLPDYSLNEKIWRLCALLDETTKEKVVIQTRNLEHPLLQAWQTNDGSAFWKKEMEEKKRFNYPPHGVLIKVTMRGKKDKIGIEMRAFEESVKKWKPMIFPAFIKTINNQHILHCLLSLSREGWVDENLLQILRELPPSVIVEVNPRSLL
jgi:primosomal protein N'